MVAGEEFWQTGTAMQNAADRAVASATDPTPTPKPGADVAEIGAAVEPAAPKMREIGGPPGPEPTRFGDWEKKGRCIDF
jgi:hypothetical protein